VFSSCEMTGGSATDREILHEWEPWEGLKILYRFLLGRSATEVICPFPLGLVSHGGFGEEVGCSRTLWMPCERKWHGGVDSAEGVLASPRKSICKPDLGRRMSGREGTSRLFKH
jgi:hypothetical protein